MGAEEDTASIIADALGLKLELVPVAWPDWPLGLESGKYDAVISKVTVTEACKEKFDFVLPPRRARLLRAQRKQDHRDQGAQGHRGPQG